MKSHINEKQYDQILKTANRLASSVIITLNLPSYEREDIVQILLIEAFKASNVYETGACSVMTFITQRLIQTKIDIIRSYVADKRALFLRCERDSQNETPSKEARMVDVVDDSAVCDVVGQANADILLAYLSPDERKLVLHLADGFSLTKSAAYIGVPLWVAKDMMEKNRAKTKKVSPTFGGQSEK